ncbi:hypothetical protein EJC49_04240 [Aquibium carbonis]|uniref:Phage integrase family protein n=1 Tax=Aquibium carbonis TaxID=2495581 RepID=A0A429Z1Z1_9HYPH|nr:hypothetical protein [Aquibium carbonis]RST87722.1 hypothetical protein EJC49_04240 [Aquibium carbonis]
MPQAIVGGTATRILRIGLGAMTSSQARARAELLAALARECFDRVKARQMNQSDADPAQGVPTFEGETPELTAAEVKGYLKAVQAMLSQPAPPTAPHQLPAFSGLRDLVLLNRELSKGPGANPLIVGNAEGLKQMAIGRVSETLDNIDRSRPAAAPLTEARRAVGGDNQDGRRTPADEQPDRTPVQQAAPGAPRSATTGPSDEQALNAPDQAGDTNSHTIAPSADDIAASVVPDAAQVAHLEGPLTPTPIAFAVAASSEPAGPGSHLRLHRDADGKIIPAHRLDRRTVERRPSRLPLLSEIADEYFDARAIKVGKNNKDLLTARNRLALFIELIGDHPVDTYSGADLQAYIALMTHWPALARHRPAGLSPWEILAANADLRHRPLKRSALEDGYVSIAKTVIGSRTIEYGYDNPLLGVKVRYPDTAAPAQATEPLSTRQLTDVFRAGVDGGLLDEALLPLLGNLTGRRLGLLVHLTGNDLREKYPGVWVAQTSGIVLSPEGLWKRVPIKTYQSTTFFVLHDLLLKIGFIDWASAQGDAFLFPALTSLKDPSKQASTYMQRLFRKAGIAGQRREVFHSLRGGHIELMRDNKVDPRDRRLQAGHKLEEEHDLYGFKSISEVRARELAHAKLNPKSTTRCSRVSTSIASPRPVEPKGDGRARTLRTGQR